jgi:PAS domain S-box-containing protein
MGARIKKTNSPARKPPGKAEIIYDPLSGKLIDANDKAKTLLGRSTSEIQKLNNKKLLPEDSITELNSLISPKGKKKVLLQTYINHKDGHKIPVKIEGKVVKRKNKVLIKELISELPQKEIVQTLKESESKFRSLVEESLVGVYIIQDGKFVYVNPTLAKIFGYDNPEEIISKKKLEDVIYEKDLELVNENIQKRLKKEIDKVHYTFRGIKKNGEIIDIEVLGTIAEYKNKPSIMGTGMDITEKKRNERELRKLSQAIQQSPVSIVITDINGNIEYVNSRFTEITGYKPEEVVGKNPRILKSGDQPDEYYKKLWEVITSGEEWHGEFFNRKKSGDFFWEFASISPIKNQNGEITNFLAIKEDITERKKTEEDLRIAKEKAEEMNRLKSIFLANMSHELRTPMVAILGYSEILKNDVENPDLNAMAKDVYDSSLRLMNTLNLVLDLSKIESQKSIIYYSEFNPGNIVELEMKSFEGLAKRKNLYLNIVLPVEPFLVFLDERMFKQIINNLISNAVKFTLKGGITVKVDKEKSDGKDWLTISITDTGIGIPKENRQIIFEEFRQISEGPNRKFEGTGLGLTITKKFVEMMNGTIKVESELGAGSSFIVQFPIIKKDTLKTKPVPEKTPKIDKEEEKVSLLPNVLLVEDDLSNAGVIEFFLRDLYEIDSVADGESAIKMAGRKRYSVVLMDIDLGAGMTGLEAAKQIKGIPGYDDTPIVAVTALAMKGNKEKFLSEGCTHYLAKPFDKNTLIKFLKDVLK